MLICPIIKEKFEFEHVKFVSKAILKRQIVKMVQKKNVKKFIDILTITLSTDNMLGCWKYTYNYFLSL